MDVSEMLTMIDQHGFEDEEVADKVRVLNLALQDVVTRDPWPYLEATTTFSAPASVNQTTGLVTTPSNFSSLMTIVNTDPNGHEIKFVRRDQHLKDHYATLAEKGAPYNYFFLAGQLHLWPIPELGNFVMDYIRIHDALTSGTLSAAILLPARHHDIIPIGAIWRLHAKEDDAENALLFKSQYDELLNNMRQDLFKVQWDSPDSVQVMSDDGDWYE